MDDHFLERNGVDPMPAVAAKWTGSSASLVIDPVTDRNDRFLPHVFIVGAGFGGLEAAQKTVQTLEFDGALQFSRDSVTGTASIDKYPENLR